MCSTILIRCTGFVNNVDYIHVFSSQYKYVINMLSGKVGDGMQKRVNGASKNMGEGCMQLDKRFFNMLLVKRN